MIIGDFNAKIVATKKTDEHPRDIMGRYDLGKRKTRGEKLIEFGA